MPQGHPNFAGPLRRSSRHRSTTGSAGGPSGSEYHASPVSVEVDPALQEPRDESPPVVYATTSRGRRVTMKSYQESASEDDRLHPEDLFDDEVQDSAPPRNTYHADDDDEDDEEHAPRPIARRSTRASSKMNFIVDSDEERKSGAARYEMRSRRKKPPSRPTTATTNTRSRPAGPSQRTRRLMRRNAAQEEGDVYVDSPSVGSVDADGSFEDAPRTSSDAEPEPEPDADLDIDAEGEDDLEQEPEADGRPYALRQRAKINYAIPPPLEEMPKPPPKGRTGGAKSGGRSGWGGGGRSRGPGWSATGAELGRWMGMPGDDSVSCF